MNCTNEHDPARQAALALSGRLGSLAAERPAARPGVNVTQSDAVTPALPPRLSAILGHLRQRARIREHAADKLRANVFLVGE
jgi:hypothetical protein